MKGSCQLLAKYVLEVLVNHLGGLNLSRKSVVRLTDGPTVYYGLNNNTTTTYQDDWWMIMKPFYDLEEFASRGV